MTRGARRAMGGPVPQHAAAPAAFRLEEQGHDWVIVSLMLGLWARTAQRC